MRKSLTLLFIFSVASCISTFAQAEEDADKKPFKVRKHLKKADKQMGAGNIYAASDLYEEILANKPDHAHAASQLAESYRIARDYKNAEKWYLQLKEMDPVRYPLAAYYAALMMKMNGKYEEAQKDFEDFAKAYRGTDATIYRRWARDEAQGCELALRMVPKPLPVNINNLGQNVNSPYTDISPLVWDENTLLYASLPSDTVIQIHKDNPVDYFIKFYSAERTGKEYVNTELFEKFNVEGEHTANGAFSPDRSRFYFNRCTQDKKTNKITCAVYMSSNEDGEWQEPIALGPEINDPKYSNSQPTIAISERGDIEILYFISDRAGGRGGTDIWYSLYNIRTGEHRAPVNAGNKINTNRDEATPYYDNTTQTLYFSSNGHVNIGGFDIYKSQGEQRRWSEPENIGYPINSSTDDMYFSPVDEGSGYFVSNRPGIISIRSETCCDDIFRFEFIEVKKVAVMGYVYEEGDTTQTPIDKARVALSLSGMKGASDIYVRDDTTAKDKYYFFNLNLDEDYKLVASKDGYLSGAATVNTYDLPKSDTMRVDIYLTPLVIDKAYRLQNIYYDYDKWDLRPESEATLDTLYSLLVENPTIIIELSSHTDSRGSDSYNMTLSQRRAESCVNYLISKGIPKERMTAKGYGETRHLNHCSNDVECTEEEHQLNRRTEFKVIGELDAKLIYEDETYEDVIEEKKGERKK